jgi:hypothetical protein
MKLLAITIMSVALFLLYRIAYPKQIKKNSEPPSESPKNLPDVMGKSRFVLPDRSKPLQTPSTSQETEQEAVKSPIFATETEKKAPTAIPVEALDKVFDEGDNPAILSIALEYENDDEDENEVDFETQQEAEELNWMLGHEPEYADGVDYGELQNVAQVVKEQPDEVSEETAGTLVKLENTDMFEQLVSGDEGKRSWITAIIDRSIQNRMPEEEEMISDTDYGDFDVVDIL